MANLDPTCIFCKIIAGELPSASVYENDHVLAFMNLQQRNPGHTLVIPKTHIPNVYELDEETAANIARAATRIAKAVKKAFAPIGLNMLQNNEPAAMQSVLHHHTHIIPRYAGDDLFAIWQAPPASGDELRQNAERLKNTLNG